MSAQVKQIKKAAKEGQKTKLLFHFLGWGPSFDEWLEVGSDRIAAHNLHTKPDCTNPREQERWQAAHGIGGETSAAAQAVSKMYKKAEDQKRQKELKRKQKEEAKEKEKEKKGRSAKRRRSSGSSAASAGGSRKRKGGSGADAEAAAAGMDEEDADDPDDALLEELGCYKS